MLNTLDDYISSSLPQGGGFTTNPNLAKKSDGNGVLLPFFGNTAVFLLDECTKARIAELQNELYSAAPDMLGERLDPDTFHMTLHDLINAPVDDENLRSEMAAVHGRAKALLDALRPNVPLRMRATWMFNMVNTSIVLGLAPCDELSYAVLDGLYCAFENVLRLGYALTPHITLAYFRPGIYGDEQLARLRNALHAVDLELALEPRNLVLQEFCDMNTYFTV